MSLQERNSLLSSLASFLLLGGVCVQAFGLELTAVLWRGEPDWRLKSPPTYFHRTWSGKEIMVKAVARHPGPVDYECDFGDSSNLATGQSQPTQGDFHFIALLHPYAGPEGSQFIAKLKVTAGTETAVVEYPVVILSSTDSVKVDVAIEDGLWYLFRNATRTQTESVPIASWNTGDWRVGQAGLAIQAFEKSNSLPGGDPARDPYVDLVQRGLNYLMSRCTTRPITAAQGDSGNLIAIACTHTITARRDNYEAGIAMMALASSHSPDRTALLGPAGVGGRTYRDIVQDMAEYYASTTPTTGGWSYYPGYTRTQGACDNSVTQWPIIGLYPFVEHGGLYPSWRTQIPTLIKTRLETWLTATWNATENGFGYYSKDYWVNIAKTAGSGITGLVYVSGGDPTEVFVGANELKSKFEKAKHYIAVNWSRATDSEGNPMNLGNNTNVLGNIYAMYAVKKAFDDEFLNREKYREIEGIDWYRAYLNHLVPKQDRVVEAQYPERWGRWEAADFHRGYYDSLTTALAVLILQRGVIETPPTAVARVTIKPADQNEAPPPGREAIEVDKGQPFYLDARNCVPGHYRIASYEWDIDGDGICDMKTSEPLLEYSYSSYGQDPFDVPHEVSLRVCDNRDEIVPSQAPLCDTDVCRVFVHPPPHPPVAIITCPGLGEPDPFACFGRPGQPIRFCSDQSFDPNEPLDAIVASCWDFDNDGVFGEPGERMTPDQPDPCGPEGCLSFTWAELGTYVVRMYVEAREEPKRSEIATKTIIIQDDLAPLASITWRFDEGRCPEIAADPGYPDNCPDAPDTSPIDILLGDVIVLSGLCSYDRDVCCGGGAGISLYEWDLDGDGTFEVTAPEVCFYRDRMGLFRISLRVADVSAHRDVSSRDILIGCRKPKAVIAIDCEICPENAICYEVDAGERVPLWGWRSDPNNLDHEIVGYAWDLDGDGYYDDGNAEMVWHSWPKPGMYAVGLRVETHCLANEGMPKYGETRTLVRVRPAGFELWLEEANRDCAANTHEVTVVGRWAQAGVQGWSWGIKHEPSQARIGDCLGYMADSSLCNQSLCDFVRCTEDVRVAGPEWGPIAFNAVAVYDNGITQGAVVDFYQARALGPRERFEMLSITYVRTTPSAELEFCSCVGGPAGRPIEPLFVVGGVSYRPERQQGLVLSCGAILFRRGDSNADGRVDIGDAICTLAYLFGKPTEPCKTSVPRCFDAADANDDGKVDIADPIATLSHLFGHAGPLKPPFGQCGIDPTSDTLNCLEFKPCRQ